LGIFKLTRFHAQFHRFRISLVVQLLALSLVLAGLVLASTPVQAAKLVLQDVAFLPVVPSVGSGQGKRALYSKAGKVGSVTVDLVAKIVTAKRDHNFIITGSRPSILATGLDDIWVDWYIYKTGTYNITTDNSDNGTSDLVEAEVGVQFSDLDGPDNEVLYVRICTGAVDYVRISRKSTLKRGFGTVADFNEAFSDAGDKNYDNNTFYPESGAEVFYNTASKFTMGRTAKSPFVINLGNPSYSKADSFDLRCTDFRKPIAKDDEHVAELGAAATISVLDNDGVEGADGTFGVAAATDIVLATINLVTPPGATGIKKAASGEMIGFTVPDQGVWSYDEKTGALTFTPQAGFTASPTPIEYTFKNAVETLSNRAKVTIAYPRLEIVKTAVPPAKFSAGEVINYTFTVSNLGSIALTGVTVTDSLPGVAIKGGPLATLAPGTVDSETFTAAYILTLADINAGKVVNTATASGALPSGKPLTSPPSVVTTDIPKMPGLSVVKTAGKPSGSTVGSAIDYTFTLTNTGNVALTNVSVTDSLPGAVLKGGPIASLAPGAIDTTTFSATYTLTQADNQHWHCRN
jgi:uncharacterized repeat protein (TIGR01451 family)